MFSIDRLNRIKLTKGDDATFKIRIYNGKDQINTGSGNLQMSVRKYPEGELLFNIEADDSGCFAIGHSLTKDADCGLYVYDVQFTSESGHISTVVKSDFELTEEVTYES